MNEFYHSSDRYNLKYHQLSLQLGRNWVKHCMFCVYQLRIVFGCENRDLLTSHLTRQGIVSQKNIQDTLKFGNGHSRLAHQVHGIIRTHDSFISPLRSSLVSIYCLMVIKEQRRLHPSHLCSRKEEEKDKGQKVLASYHIPFKRYLLIEYQANLART